LTPAIAFIPQIVIFDSLGFLNEPPRQASGHRRFILEGCGITGEQIPRAPSMNRPKGRGIKP